MRTCKGLAKGGEPREGMELLPEQRAERGTCGEMGRSYLRLAVEEMERKSPRTSFSWNERILHHQKSNSVGHPAVERSRGAGTEQEVRCVPEGEDVSSH